MIFGENATGKSTIVDALDFVCNGVFGSLASRSSARPAVHVPSVGREPKDLVVRLQCGKDAFSASLAKSKISRTPADGHPRVSILRRERLQVVVAAVPADRYKELRSLIDLPRVSPAETALRTVVGEKSRAFDTSSHALTTAVESLERMWIAAGKPEPTPDAWAASLDVKHVERLQLRQRKGRAISADMATCAKESERSKAATALVDEASTGLRLAEATLATLLSRSQEAGAEIVTLLQAARDFLGKRPSPAECPVCESSERLDDLEGRVEKRLAAFKAVQEAIDAVARAKTRRVETLGGLEEARRAFVGSVRSLKARLQSQAALPSGQQMDWSRWSTLDMPDDGVQAAAAAAALWTILENEVGAVDYKVQAIDEELLKAREVGRALEAISQAREAATALEGLSKRLQALLLIVESERKAYVDDVLRRISLEVNRLYSAVHPGEKVGDLSVLLDPKSQGSLHIQSSFEGQTGVPPQAYFSDSHLDTLGICIFLALAELQSGGVVVLDDVLSSADDQHIDRVMRLLDSESSRFERIVLTTHYRPLFDGLRRQGMGTVQVMELGGWSIEQGVRIAATRIQTDELAALLGSFPLDRQAIASKAGVFIEESLDFLTRRLRLKTVRDRKEGLTFAEFAEGIEKKIAPLIKIKLRDGTVIEVGQVLRRIVDRNYIRNRVGAHFNVDGAAIPDREIIAYGEDVLLVAKALFCPECGKPPDKNKAGTCFECACGARSLEPIEIPRSL